MNKKISTVAILIICIVLAGGATVGVLHKDGIISSDSIFAPKPSENNRPSGNSAVASGSSLSSNRKITREALLKNGAEYSLQHDEGKDALDTVYRDMVFKVNGIDITKKKGNFDKRIYGSENVDSSGNTIGSYSYVVIHLSVTDKCKTDHIVGVNSYTLIFNRGEKDGIYGIEPYTYNSGGLNSMDKEYFIISLKPGKAYNFNLAYVVKDDILKKYKDGIMVLCISGDSGKQPVQFDSLPVVDKNGHVSSYKEAENEKKFLQQVFSRFHPYFRLLGNMVLSRKDAFLHREEQYFFSRHHAV